MTNCPVASFTTGRAAPIYLYGMIVYSTIHRLGGDYPEADGYAEIAETHRVPGGETGNAALVLAHWGHRVKVGGPFLGRETRDGVAPFLGRRGIDCSGLHYDEGFEGVRDLVLVGGSTRTVFGAFGRYFRGPKRWSPPTRAPSPPRTSWAWTPSSARSRGAWRRSARRWESPG